MSSRNAEARICPGFSRNTERVVCQISFSTEMKSGCASSMGSKSSCTRVAIGLFSGLIRIPFAQAQPVQRLHYEIHQNHEDAARSAQQNGPFVSIGDAERPSLAERPCMKHRCVEHLRRAGERRANQKLRQRSCPPQ